MSRCEHRAKPLIKCLRSATSSTCSPQSQLSFRSFASLAQHSQEVQVNASKPAFYKTPQPETVTSPRLERRLIRAGIRPIGSRRRRAALQDSDNIPFEQLPYQCFQEARKILQEDREEKLKQIEVERARIARLKAADPATCGGEQRKQTRLQSMLQTLEILKIHADINDPMIKKRFEDGQGDMNKPIYRFLADKKWREQRRPILVQRITQMNVIPDVLPHIDPVADVRLSFDSKTIPPGDFVESIKSEKPGTLDIQLFERGEKLVTIAVVDSDVPDVQNDAFDYRCHFLAVNIPITPTSPSIVLDQLSESDVLLPWLAPFAQKGSPYHRLSVFILQQKDNMPLDISQAKAKLSRDGFRLRSFTDRHRLHPFGVTMFRTRWDEGMAGVMKRADVPGWDIELKRKKVEPLPYKRRNPASFR